VRQVAVDLLGRLPASRRAARMVERLQALVSVGDGPDGVLSFVQPGEPDAAARRDGINDASPAGMGRAAWRLAQLVAAAPLSFWTDRLGLSPAQVVEAAAERSGVGRKAMAGPVLLGLESAVVAQAGRADPDWAVAVFSQRRSAAVLAAMPADLAAAQLARLLGGGLGPSPAVAELFAACPGPWPESLSQAVLDRYRQLGARATLELQTALPALAARLDPATLPLVETWVVALADNQSLRRRVQTLGHALSLRAVIQREFPA
jgi:hypothetical protein